jgi:hypothetical protein
MVIIVAHLRSVEIELKLISETTADVAPCLPRSNIFCWL